MKNGFTLIELLVVIAILGIIVKLAVPISMIDFHTYSFRDERSKIITALQKVRSQSMNNICLGTTCTDGMSHGIHFETGDYVIFQGSIYNPLDPTNERMSENSAITTRGVSDVIFAQLSGDASTTPNGIWNVVVDDTTGNTSTLTFNTEGEITWTN
jgi:prepilin-type N-terminal cleavage/methylation domain-containing protein